MTIKRVFNFWLMMVIVISCQKGYTQVANGDLTIELIGAYNFAVDSNDPSSGPQSAYIGVEICNTGADDLTNIIVQVGDYTNGTPGIYPSRTVSELSYSGIFSFDHANDCDEQDAYRMMESLSAGACYTQYWLIQYPIMDDAGNSVAGANTINDDLYLEWDVWVTADDNGTPLNVDDTFRTYMRSMLSASANKAWPNGTGKVPEEYLQIFQDSLGWRPDTTNQIAGCLFTLEGIWYDLGNINKGFDNDGDLVPDYNVFLQPVGNASTFDNCCFRLLKNYGVLIIKLTGGGEKIIAFEDQFYHTDIPDNNNGGVGLVYYEYVPLSAPCAGLITPYQNVASGNNNEKYSGDFGVTLGGPTSEVPPASLDMTGPATSAYDADIEFTITVNNTTNKSLGIAEYYEALNIVNMIPEGTVYVSGSAAANNMLPSGITVTPYYSTDGGLTFVQIEPTASDVTHVKWVFNENLPATETADLTIKLQAPFATYASPFVINEATLNFGNGDPLFYAMHTVLLLGVNELGGTVFSDNGGTTGILGNGIQDGNEGGIANIGITLYFDINGNNVLDADDYYLGDTNTAGDGSYTFTGLPDGNFIVVLDGDDPDLPAGAGLSTQGLEILVNLNASDNFGINFGYTPALQIIKSVASDPLYYEARDVVFDITVKNLISSEVGDTTSAFTVRDEFSAYSYSNNDGTADWSSNWIESEGDGPTAGDITINNPALRLVVSTGGSIMRNADLTTAASATLSFIHRTQSGTGSITLEISNDNGSSWSTIESFAMSTDETSGTAVSYDISSYLSSTNDITVRLLHSGGTGIKSFDDLQIAYFVGSSGEDCNIVNLYINHDDKGDYSPVGALYGPPDDNYAQAFWGNFLEVSSFNVPSNSNNIVKVEGVIKTYKTGTLVDDYWLIRPTENGSTSGFNAITSSPADVAGFNSVATAGELAFDLTSERSSWDWSNFSAVINAEMGMLVQAFSVSSDDGAIPFLDAIWFRITTDEVCTATGNNNLVYNANSALDPVPLVDMYDPDSLEFVTAATYPDSIDEVNGKLYWDDIGPIVAGDSSTVIVTFKPKNVANNISGSATNMGFVNEALFGNGDMANSDTSTAQILIEPAGSISGFVWSDANGNGWAGSTGYASPEQFIPGVTLTLYSCTNVANNGSCNGILLSTTTTTDENGAYLFEGLESNLKYYIEVDESTMPSSFVNQTGDPDDDPNRGSGNGGTCGSGGANARCDASWDNDGDWFEIGVDFWGSESWDLTEINFGYEINPIAYGVVWEDVNGNGVREASEPGIEGVTVEFVTPSCTPGVNCPTELTDTNGEYRFENLSTANNNNMTIVQSTLPNGNTWTQTFESDGTINNDIDVDVSSGDIEGSFDFGFYPTGTGIVGDKVFYDQDGDGRFDSGEEGMPNISIDLYRDMNGNGILDVLIDIFLSSDITDASGEYTFSGLAEGDYVVVVDEMDLDFPSNVFQTSDPDELGICTNCDGVGGVSINSDINTTIDFGYLPYGSAVIGDLVWRDLDGNQLVTSILESGLSNISVNLYVDYNNDGAYVYLSSTSTDEDGIYSFRDLADANYIVEVNTADADFPLDSYGEDMIATTPSSDTITVAGGQVNVINGASCSDCDADIDFGFAFPGAIGNLVFYDNNANATQDLSEKGIPEVTVYLCYNSVGTCNSSLAIANTVTDLNGFYLFAGLTQGEYKIAIDEASLPIGISGGSQTGDPDRDGVACDDNTYPSLPACDNEAIDLEIFFGTRLLGIDFSYVPPGVIGDLIWLDSDGNGLQNNGEPGIGNVDVTIDPPSGVDLGSGLGNPVTIQTDLSGNYSFANLPDGTYLVGTTPPSGYTSNYEIDGTLDNQVVVVVNGGIVDNVNNTWCSNPSGCDLDLDFGYSLSGSFNVRGVVCIDDLSEDGVCSTSGEALQSGILLYLYNDEAVFLGSTITDSAGAYSFEGLPADTYSVSLSTNAEPYNLLTLTTQVNDTPASSITNTGTSIFQTFTISASSITGLDFAFVFDGEVDFGDLPSPYATLLDDFPSGPYHVISGIPTLYFGSYVDTEDIPIQNRFSTGDDLNGFQDDEDGITPLNTKLWTNGIDGGEIQIEVTGTGWLVGYIDFDNDGSFSDAGEMIINQSISSGTSIITFDIPNTTEVDKNTQFYSRFRLFENAPLVPELAFTGFSISGEVEDYLLFVVKSRKITTNIFIPHKLRNRNN